MLESPRNKYISGADNVSVGVTELCLGIGGMVLAESILAVIGTGSPLDIFGSSVPAVLGACCLVRRLLLARQLYEDSLR
ncbi:hypothetical protein JW962_00845 [Candidatus Dojkabacteria bacterium]|nr:hypothetical protein [Candidatus Dojkabacteria bacterium]